MAQDITGMQTTINERLGKVRDQLDRGRVSAKTAQQVKPMLVELQEGATKLDNLATQGN